MFRVHSGSDCVSFHCVCLKAATLSMQLTAMYFPLRFVLHKKNAALHRYCVDITYHYLSVHKFSNLIHGF